MVSTEHLEKFRTFEETGKLELGFQNCYDHGLAFYSLDKIFGTRTRTTEPIIY